MPLDFAGNVQFFRISLARVNRSLLLCLVVPMECNFKLIVLFLPNLHTHFAKYQRSLWFREDGR